MASAPVSQEAAEALTTELSHDLMSPYCPGRTISSCTSPQARKLEQYILNEAQAGKSRAEIEGELVKRFPDIQGYLGRPELLWGTALGAVLAMAALAWAARRWLDRGRRASAAGVAGAAVTEGSAAPRAASPRELAALEDALDRVDEF
jgi:cytochrome c-type biogenesis protein CcmH/NrfF